ADPSAAHEEAPPAPAAHAMRAPERLRHGFLVPLGRDPREDDAARQGQLVAGSAVEIGPGAARPAVCRPRPAFVGEAAVVAAVELGEPRARLAVEAGDAPDHAGAAFRVERAIVRAQPAAASAALTATRMQPPSMAARAGSSSPAATTWTPVPNTSASANQIGCG